MAGVANTLAVRNAAAAIDATHRLARNKLLVILPPSISEGRRSPPARDRRRSSGLAKRRTAASLANPERPPC
jgi:hypothetical protein